MPLPRNILLIALVLLIAACGPSPQPESEAPAASAPATEAAAPGSGADHPCRIEPPAQPVMCTADWNPVCGCDGKTYSNACNAGAAGVTRFEPGECDKKDRL